MSPCSRLGQRKIKDIAINSGAPRTNILNCAKLSWKEKGSRKIVIYYA
ncbi:MAG: hypothetical protein ABSB40_04895 [Nitrososphaeria archaeon]